MHLIDNITPINGIIITITLNTIPKLNIINTYCPQSGIHNIEHEAIKTTHWEIIQKAFDGFKHGNSIKILVGDLNCRLINPPP